MKRRTGQASFPHGSHESWWALTLQSYGWWVLALGLGVALAVPAVEFGVMHRRKSYSESVYMVGTSPHQEQQLTRWARSQPLIESFTCERRGPDLWVHWEFRGLAFQAPAAVQETMSELRQLGYNVQGFRESGAGAVSRNPQEITMDVLTDVWTLGAMLIATQVSFGVIGWLRVRAEAKNGCPLPRLFQGNHGFALAIGLGAGGLVFALSLLYPLALRALLGRSPSRPWDVVSQMPASTRTVFLCFGVLVAPWAEELFFRGFIFGLFERAHLVRVGLFVSATLFAAAHFSDASNIPAIWIMGVVFGWLYHRTGSLLAPIAAHVLNNALAITTMFWI